MRRSASAINPAAAIRPAIPTDRHFLWRDLLVLGGVAALALTSVAAVGALVLSLVVFVGELAGRRQYSLAAVIMSTLYAAEAPFGLPTVPLVVGMLCLAFVFRTLASPRPTNAQPLVGFLLLGLTFVVSAMARPPVTEQGWFVVLEQGCILLTLGVFVTTSADQLGTGERSREYGHAALVAVALVAGFDAIRYVDDNAGEYLQSQQIVSVYGGSNYVAALLTLAAVSSIYLGLVAMRNRALNLTIAAVCVVMIIPLGSRSSGLALALVTAYLLTAAPGRRAVRVLVATAVVAFAMLSPSVPMISRMLGTDSTSWIDLNGREDLWAFAVHQIWTHPFLGQGSGRLADSLLASGSTPYYVHDIWLSLLVQFGFLIVVVLVKGLRALFAPAFDRQTQVIVAALLVISTIEPAIETLRIGLIFAALVGIGVITTRSRLAGAAA